MTDLSLLGALPCEKCGQTGVDRPAECICMIFRDTGGFRIADLTCLVHGLSGVASPDAYWESCPSCNGVGFVPDPATLETMAEAIWREVYYRSADRDWNEVKGIVGTMYYEAARAVWEALIRPAEEGEMRGKIVTSGQDDGKCQNCDIGRLPCEECGGHGWEPIEVAMREHPRYRGACPACHGVGFVPRGATEQRSSERSVAELASVAADTVSVSQCPWEDSNPQPAD